MSNVKAKKAFKNNVRKLILYYGKKKDGGKNYKEEVFQSKFMEVKLQFNAIKEAKVNRNRKETEAKANKERKETEAKANKERKETEAKANRNRKETEAKANKERKESNFKNRLNVLKNAARTLPNAEKPGVLNNIGKLTFNKKNVNGEIRKILNVISKIKGNTKATEKDNELREKQEKVNAEILKKQERNNVVRRDKQERNNVVRRDKQERENTERRVRQEKLENEMRANQKQLASETRANQKQLASEKRERILSKNANNKEIRREQSAANREQKALAMQAQRVRQNALQNKLIAKENARQEKENAQGIINEERRVIIDPIRNAFIQNVKGINGVTLKTSWTRAGPRQRTGNKNIDPLLEQAGKILNYPNMNVGNVKTKLGHILGKIKEANKTVIKKRIPDALNKAEKIKLYNRLNGTMTIEDKKKFKPIALNNTTTFIIFKQRLNLLNKITPKANKLFKELNEQRKIIKNINKNAQNQFKFETMGNKSNSNKNIQKYTAELEKMKKYIQNKKDQISSSVKNERAKKFNQYVGNEGITSNSRSRKESMATWRKKWIEEGDIVAAKKGLAHMKNMQRPSLTANNNNNNITIPELKTKLKKEQNEAKRAAQASSLLQRQLINKKQVTNNELKALNEAQTKSENELQEVIAVSQALRIELEAQGKETNVAEKARNEASRELTRMKQQHEQDLEKLKIKNTEIAGLKETMATREELADKLEQEVKYIREQALKVANEEKLKNNTILGLERKQKEHIESLKKLKEELESALKTNKSNSLQKQLNEVKGQLVTARQTAVNTKSNLEKALEKQKSLQKNLNALKLKINESESAAKTAENELKEAQEKALTNQNLKHTEINELKEKQKVYEFTLLAHQSALKEAKKAGHNKNDIQIKLNEVRSQLEQARLNAAKNISNLKKVLGEQTKGREVAEATLLQLKKASKDITESLGKAQNNAGRVRNELNSEKVNTRKLQETINELRTQIKYFETQLGHQEKQISILKKRKSYPQNNRVLKLKEDQLILEKQNQTKQIKKLQNTIEALQLSITKGNTTETKTKSTFTAIDPAVPNRPRGGATNGVGAVKSEQQSLAEQSALRVEVQKIAAARKEKKLTPNQNKAKAIEIQNKYNTLKSLINETPPNLDKVLFAITNLRGSIALFKSPTNNQSNKYKQMYQTLNLIMDNGTVSHPELTKRNGQNVKLFLEQLVVYMRSVGFTAFPLIT